MSTAGSEHDPYTNQKDGIRMQRMEEMRREASRHRPRGLEGLIQE